ncbi:hypothetical protein HYW18_00325 [Candidatus Uhrbacteria bacterium]|nr:hypothetical protein [Candidatus Uhrbacteria bacterium]
MLRILNFFRREWAYLCEVSVDQRRLLGGAFLYGVATPVVYVFSNTYLWRQSADPIVLALFNTGFFGGLWFGFLGNGLLLRRFASPRLYFLGCLLQGLVPITLVTLHAKADSVALLLGLVLGVAGGFYWGNRNYLTSELTVGPRRLKFISLESTATLLAAVLSPVITGWLLVLGERTGWYTTQSAYQVAAGFAFVVLIVAGLLVAHITHVLPPLEHLRIHSRRGRWNQLRLLEVFNGFVDGLEGAIPLVILLTFVGLEHAIGTIDSLAAILASLGLYLIGKWARHDHHINLLRLWVVFTFLGRALFSLLYSTAGALVFYTVEGFVGGFRWNSMVSVVYETIDREQDGQASARRYAYLTDRELFLNAGRVSALLLFIVLYANAPEFTIRYGLLLGLAAQIPLLVLAKKQIRPRAQLDSPL